MRKWGAVAPALVFVFVTAVSAGAYTRESEAYDCFIRGDIAASYSRWGKAQRELTAACALDPSNARYRARLKKLEHERRTLTTLASESQYLHQASGFSNWEGPTPVSGAGATADPGYTNVSGYTRQNGTVVDSYFRRSR